MIIHFKTLCILFKTFGFKFKYLIIPIYRFLYSIIRITGELFDFLFYYKYKRARLLKPVFLIGHPRSGTTFLHKFILNNTNEFKGMFLWEMIFPSISLRKLISPILPFLQRKFPKEIYDPNIHKTGLLEAETDDVALFFKSFKGMFYWLYFSAWKSFVDFEEVKRDLVNTSNQKSAVKYLKTLHKKNLAYSNINKRIFSKSFSFILDINEIFNNYQGAKVIILMRDPKEVIPSSISLAKSVQEKINDFSNLKDNYKEQYYKNLYNASLSFYKLFDEQMTSNTYLRENVLVISHKNLKNDFENTMRQICVYSEIEITQKLMNTIKNQALKQPSFKAKHKYSLQEFGFTEEEVSRDFNFIYSKYDL
ncbi:MAG: sulfotransferase [Bacteroidales bacterium]|nr:sulfotransferase [Bacteroidales bacterium]